jgi:ABC-type uncharacterized transport system permease subunit
MIVFALGVGAYSVGSTLFFSGLFRRPTSRLLKAARLALGLGVVAHLVYILWTSFLTHKCPIESMHFALSASALVMAAVFWALGPRFRVEPLGALVGPIALGFWIAAEFLARDGVAPRVPRFWLSLHIAANLFGVGLFLLAGVASGFYLYVERNLKRKQKTLIPGAMPALDSLDLTAYRLLILGYPLLTFGVVTGGMFLSELNFNSPAELVRPLLGYSSWLLLGLVLLWRGPLGNRGRKSAIGTLLGVSCVLLLLLFYLTGEGQASSDRGGAALVTSLGRSV